MNHSPAVFDPAIRSLSNQAHEQWPCCFRSINLVLVLLSLVGCVSRLEAADATVIIPGGSGTFTTNIVFNTTALGAHKTLSVAPANGYHFKAAPTVNFDSSVIMVQQTSYTECGAMYEMWLVGSHREGTVQISGTITPGSCNSGGGNSGQGGSGGPITPPTDRGFEINVLQRQTVIYFTDPANGTNLTICAGRTTNLAVKVVLGDATAPSSGTVTFSAPSNLGAISPGSVALDGEGKASSLFSASNESGSGTLTATGSSIKDSSGKAVPDVSKGLAVNNADITGVTAQGAVAISKVLGDQKMLHFVTPKGPADSLVTLTATANPDNPTVKNSITWEGAAQDANDPLKATVPKHAVAKKVVKIKVNGQVSKELRVWVVWGSVHCDDFAIDVKDDGTELAISQARRFEWTVLPKEILEDRDIPDLGGPKKNDPPGGNNSCNEPLSKGASRKWDNSRQIRGKFIRPDDCPVHCLDNLPENYPISDVEGNDDARTTDEDNDPYGLDGFAKLIIGNDPPGRKWPHAWGANGFTIEHRLQFREFLRLELEGTWYRISDPYLWRLHIKFVKRDGKWQDNGTTKASDNEEFGQ